MYNHITETSYFFRMLAKVRTSGYRESDIYTMTVDQLRRVRGLTAYNILMIVKLQQTYKEARLNEQRKCRI